MNRKKFKQLIRDVSSYIFQEMKDDLEICPESYDDIINGPDEYINSFVDLVDADLDKLVRRFKVAQKRQSE